MTIASEITKLNTNLTNCYTAVNNKGGTLPQAQNFDNLATAIGSISTGGTINSLTVTPTTSVQTITASGGVDGYSPITVNAVTSSIDNNITAGNIKSGVNILGVTGNYTGTTPTLITKNITQNGTYNASSDNADGYSSVTVNVSGGGGSVTPLNYQIFYDSSVTSEEIIAPAFANKIFLNGSLIRCIDIENSIFFTPHQTSIIRASSLVMNGYGKPQLKEVHLDALETVTGNRVFQTSFQDCTNLITLTFSNLATASANSCFGQMCKNCTSLTTVFYDKLSTLSGSYAFGGSAAQGGAFTNCTSLATLSFPSLTSTSFGSYTNQFNMMLKGVTGCTVHFPSNLQSVIGSWSSVTSGFGGTNTIVLFDLPATS